MPFPNEHAARIEDPDRMQPDSFRRFHGGSIQGVQAPDTIDIIKARPEGENDAFIPQSLRFPTDDWSEAEARDWLETNEIDYIRFEPAENEESAMNEKYIALTRPVQLAALDVDREKGLMKGVPLITKGPAEGHGFDVDDVMVEQVANKANEKPNGLKIHFVHDLGGLLSGKTRDGVEVLVGFAENARVDGDKARVDVQFGEFAKSSPKGDLWTYLFDIAEDERARGEVGLSIVFVEDEFEERTDEDGMSLPPAGRIRELLAADFTDDPGANPDGMLSRRFHRNNPIDHGENTMNEGLRKYLESIGLDADASDEQAQEFLEGLEGQQAEIAQLLKSDDDGNGLSQVPVNRGNGEGGGEEPTSDPDDDDIQLSAEQIAEKKFRELQEAERKRVKQLRGLAEEVGLGADKAVEWIDNDTSLEEARQEAIEKLAKDHRPLSLGGGDSGTARVGSVRNPGEESLAQAVTDAILLRAGRPLVQLDAHNRVKRLENGQIDEREPHERASRFRALSLIEMGRAYLTELGVPDAHMLTRPQVADLALSPRQLQAKYGIVSLAQGTSDFTSILADSMNKSLRAAYAEASRTWDVWARRTTNPDFKDITRTSLSDHPDLVQIDEAEGVRYVTLSDSGETYALAEYQAGVKLTRRAIINDDMSAFDRMPQVQAAAGRRKEDDVCYSILTANAAMDEDSVALFHNASHGNLASSGGAPATATLNSGRAAMRTQTGPQGANLNIVPRYLIAPANLEGTVKKVLNSEADPTASGNSGVANIWRGQLTPVIESRLDTTVDSDTDNKTWYLAADYNQIDTVEVCFLEGEEVPQLRQETDFDSGDAKFVVRHTVAAKAIDYRGLYKDPGD